MSNYYQYPKLIKVKPLDDYNLLVTFDNGVIKKYDFNKFLSKPAFSNLKDILLFKSVRIDSGGCGVIWNDQMDLAESELWINGIEI